MPFDTPMLRTIVPELLATGSVSTRWFHGLFGGNTVHPPTRGAAPPVAAAMAPTPTAAMTSRTESFLTSRQASADAAQVARLLTLVVAFALAVPATASANAYLPPPGKTFAGVTGGYDASSFERETGSHPAVFQFFGGWNQTTTYMFDGAASAHSRLMIHLSTVRGTSEQITPRGIATGRGDDYLLALGRRIAGYGGITYIRLMAEMDGHWNAYCAYTASGRSKGSAYTTGQFRRAWKRTVLILRGGPVARVDAKLRALGMPPVRTSTTDLPRPRVAFLWVPQVAGAPDTRANSPRAYWPGAKYVDWVGTDFYSKFPNWSGLQRFYGDSTWRGKPFAFGEWAIWGRDDPAFVHALFGWSRSHRRVRMLLYNQGKLSDGPFRLVHYPRSRRALAAELRARRIADFAPELLAR
jgi:hypothetical protein